MIQHIQIDGVPVCAYRGEDGFSINLRVLYCDFDNMDKANDLMDKIKDKLPNVDVKLVEGACCNSTYWTPERRKEHWGV